MFAFIQHCIQHTRFSEVERSLYRIQLVRLSACGKKQARPVFSTILARSILYLHILSTNSQACVACFFFFVFFSKSQNKNFYRFCFTPCLSISCSRLLWMSSYKVTSLNFTGPTHFLSAIMEELINFATSIYDFNFDPCDTDPRYPRPNSIPQALMIRLI